MKIKSLLLGSAAALVAVSSAQAADAIVVEPEPVEYVRVCDAYGSGFFYIPGTETCMRISGYVRSTYSATHRSSDYTINGVDVDTDTASVQIIGGYGADVNTGGGRQLATSTVTYVRHNDVDTHFWGVRGRLNIDVRNETEWGTLRSQLRLQAGDSNVQDANVAMDRALISVGGFRLGYSDNFMTTHHGYGFHRAIADGFYSYDQAIFFDYTWAANGFSITAGVQDSESNALQFNGGTPTPGAGRIGGGGTADYYVGFKYSGSWGNIALSALHDSRAWDDGSAYGVGALAGLFADDTWVYGEGAWVYKASFDWDLSEYFAGGALRAWYMGADSPYTYYMAGGATTHTPIDHQWGVSMQASLGDNLNGYVGYTARNGNDDKNGISYDEWAASVGLVWAPITGLTVQTEYNWGNLHHESNAGAYSHGGNAIFNQVDRTADVDRSTFYVRITRSW